MGELDESEELEPKENDRFIDQNEDNPASPRSTMGITEPKPNTHEETYIDNMLLFSLFGVVQIFGICALVLSVVWANVYLKGFSWDGSGTNFNWHIIFMTSFIYVYGNAALVYRVTRKMDKYTAKLIHGGANALAFLFAVLGLVAVFRFHNAMLIPNMYSLHSWVGVSTVTLYACQLVFGFLSFLYPRMSDDNLRRMYLHVHVYFGGVMLAMVVVASLSGITEKVLFSFKAEYSKFVAVTYVANFLGVMIVLFVMGVGYILYNSDWKRVE